MIYRCCSFFALPVMIEHVHPPFHDWRPYLSISITILLSEALLTSKTFYNPELFSRMMIFISFRNSCEPCFMKEI